MALPARGKFRGPTEKAEDLGLTLFLSYPLHSCRQAWVAILRAARGHTKPVSVRGSSLFQRRQLQKHVTVIKKLGTQSLGETLPPAWGTG